MKKIFLLVMGAAWMLHSCSSDSNKINEKKAIPTKTTTIKTEKVSKTYTFSGTISSVKKSTLSTRIMGQIDKVLVHEGDKVEKGQLLVALKSNDIVAKKSQVEANIAATKAAYKNAQTDYKRIQKLHKSKSATQKELDDITTHFLMTKAQLKAAEEAQKQVEETLNYANIRAPYDGVITERFVDGGDMANPGIPLVAIESPNKFEVIARVPESEIDLIEKADSVTVLLNHSNKVIKGYVSRVSPSSRFSGSQFEARVILEPTNEQLSMIRSGIYAKVELAKGTEEKILVPSDLIINRGQLNGVWTVSSSGHAMLRWVQLGKSFDNKKEVISGLSNGDQLILECDSRLYDGLFLSLN
ncbi:efflux RND transporter periplasmic adaptor subunit [Carboxylicivirga linearis]|uniref:Efflux RND transporter periplasmic adaptor subunit n=1 Tax=Carboxylicivirga linearis TaxID=1628157 RepID=A0ABS5JVH8_9BACT|nr:efflux RND transporter periplasmic adaptor subunit [Carboxylicivirga linearis]MBS2098901.1 efflux RND transporter periplasmic adaptor subunit [Carboxylicivirga linearis]